MSDPNDQGVFIGGSYDAVRRNLLFLIFFADKKEGVHETAAQHQFHALSKATWNYSQQRFSILVLPPRGRKLAKIAVFTDILHFFDDSQNNGAYARKIQTLWMERRYR